MAFLARCPHCSRPQRVDVLRDVELHDAGDVFVKCNDWSNCGAMFIASGFSAFDRGVRCVLTWPMPSFDVAGWAIGAYYAALNQAAATKRRAEQLVSFMVRPWERVVVLTPQQRDLHLG